MRVVLDTSVVVAALITSNARSASRVVLAAAASGAVDLVVTDALEAEYRRAVEYPQVRKLAAKVDRQAFVSGVVAACLLSFDAHLTRLRSVGEVKTLRPGDFLAALRSKD